MSLFEKIKDIYWGCPLLGEDTKQKIFYSVKGFVRGKSTGNSDANVLKAYIQEIMDNQDLDNSFSIDYPKGPSLSRTNDDPKLIAYYLPQFYPDKHNDEWWGKGSTEWTNVSKSVPQYLGQYQPRLPGELGFYDLRIQENIYRQIDLAKIFGIYGFCFYYYWFDGIRLLDLPFDNFVNDECIDFPFSICWVNESWTKQWSGSSNIPLMVQNDSVESYQNFIESCYRLFTKDNYIKIDGKPVLSVYKPLKIPKPKQILQYWRNFVKKKTGQEIYIVAVFGTSYDELDNDFIDMGFNAVSEFAPGPHMKLMNKVNSNKKFICDEFYGSVYDYKEFVDRKKYFVKKADKLYRAISPMWDNTARKKNKGLVLDGATPELYKQWLTDIIVETKNNKTLDDKHIYINAWNEWAEGTYLEPDLKWKYGYLAATREAILEARKIEKL